MDGINHVVLCVVIGNLVWSLVEGVIMVCVSWRRLFVYVYVVVWWYEYLIVWTDMYMHISVMQVCCMLCARIPFHTLCSHFFMIILSCLVFC